MWLPSKWLRDAEEGAYQVLEVRSLIGKDTSVKHIPMQYNGRLKKSLANTIFITYRDTFLIDGSRPNNSLASVLSTQPGEYHDWRGPIVAYAKRGPSFDPPACKDFDMVDFRHVTDYFLSYGNIAPEAEAKAEAGVERVKGVRINCLGDVKMLNRPHFEAVELPSTDPIFTTHATSDIADRIGLPILTRRCPLDPKWANSQDAMFEKESPTDNQDATFLHQCCDPRATSDLSLGSLGWGWCSIQWQNNVGSAIAVRKDRKPLHPIHMEALAGYCRNEVQPLMGHSLGEYYPEEPIGKDDVLKIICRPMFVIYWSKFLEERKDYTTTSPYE